ncbi:MAG: hypothetical protein ACOYU4_05655 [Thermodesulfobacteriota bacterium]
MDSGYWLKNPVPCFKKRWFLNHLFFWGFALLHLFDTEIIDARESECHFILLAEKFGARKSGPPRPLRRILSLMRHENLRCQTILYKYSLRPPEKSCSGDECGLRRVESCNDYVKNVPLYNHKLIAKHCHKLCFIRKRLDKKEDIQFLVNEDLIGYCIVHADERIINGVESDLSYVTEAIIPPPFRRGYVSCPNRADIEIEGKYFSITGNYFAQQNSITNCCSHAAIKMATRKCFLDQHEIACETMNQNIGVDHKNVKGNALDLVQIKNVIENVLHMRAFGLNFFSRTPDQFLRMVYHALESRFPVLLFFPMPERDEKAGIDNSPGHAVALTGHTLNQHNWVGYALHEYFSNNKKEHLKLDFLSSYLWCDSFVIQDDVMGPHYVLPLSFLKNMLILKNILDVRELLLESIPLPISIDYPWLTYESLQSIIIFPKEFSFVVFSSEAENRAYDCLCRLIKGVKKEKLPNTVFFTKYFVKNYEQNTLILRTLAISKGEYLKSVSSNKTITEAAGDRLDKVLPSRFWVVEISIPELFWTNKGKIGELILDPAKLHNEKKQEEKNKEQGKNEENKEQQPAVFLRLPNFCCYPGDDEKKSDCRKFDQKNSYDPLISLTNPPWA